MYKILITTSYVSPNGVAVHSVVVEFDTATEAQIAIDAVSAYERGVYEVRKEAVALY